MTQHLLIISMIGLTFCSCVSAPPIDKAIVVHNIYRSMLLDLDAAMAPLLSEAEAQARIDHPDDARAFVDAMKPWTEAVEALAMARQAEQAMHLSISQWDATGDEGKVLRETYACAATAIDRVSNRLGVLPHGSPLYAAAFAIGTQLRAQADGLECEVKK